MQCEFEMAQEMSWKFAYDQENKFYNNKNNNNIYNNNHKSDSYKQLQNPTTKSDLVVLAYEY